jgi:hypothetical protein
MPLMGKVLPHLPLPFGLASILFVGCGAIVQRNIRIAEENTPPTASPGL